MNSYFSVFRATDRRCCWSGRVSGGSHRAEPTRLVCPALIPPLAREIGTTENSDLPSPRRAWRPLGVFT